MRQNTSEVLQETAGGGKQAETPVLLDLQMLLSKVQGYATAFAGILQDIPRT